MRCNDWVKYYKAEVLNEVEQVNDNSNILITVDDINKAIAYKEEPMWILSKEQYEIAKEFGVIAIPIKDDEVK